jgi:hypothetical protein
MNLKKLILAGVGIASLAGTAEAVELKVSKIADVTQDYKAAAPLKVASEMLQGTKSGANNDRDETVALVTGSVSTGTFPTGNTIVTMTVSGAKFDSAVTGAAVDFTACTKATPNATATLSSGGAEGAVEVKWVFSDLNDCGPGEAFVITLPLDLDLGGAGVSVSVGIATEGSNTPVDGGTATVSNFITTSAAAFSTKINEGDDATADVASVAPFTSFTGPSNSTGVLGDVQLKADTTVAVDISGTQVFAKATDYDTATVTLAGDLSAFQDGTDSVELDNTAASALTASSATFDAEEGGDFGGVFTGATDFDLNTDADTPIPASGYTVAVSSTLDAGLTGAGNLSAPASASATAISSIVRNGSYARLPWVVSNSQATASGTGAVNYVRVTNPTANAYGKVTATVIASNNVGTVGDTVTLAESVAPGGELLVNSGSLETLLGSNFGRGDIELAVEGVRATIVQLVARPDGVYTIDNTPYTDGNTVIP